MDWDGNFIVDDEMREIFSRIPKDVNLEIILDSCHSGTGARELTAIKNVPLELSFKHGFIIILYKKKIKELDGMVY
jgi:hypothetical protein